MYSLKYCINIRPSVSILIPTYNRKHFEKLIQYNINNQDYTNIKEVIICDDGDDNLILDIQYDIIYIKKKKKMDLGDKRNLLSEMASGEILVNMDTDDLYNKSYISYSIDEMIKQNKRVSGTASMLIYFIKEDKKCQLINHSYYKANEGTLVFRKSYWDENKYDKKLQEGITFLKGKSHEIADVDIFKIMICIAHKNNTINKDRWLENEYKGQDFPDLQKLKELKLI